MAKIGEQEWEKLMENLSVKFNYGEIITHQYLKKVFFLADPDFEEFETQEEFVEAINLVQFEYMSLVDKLRWDMLKKYKLYLRNIRGDGYTFLLPEEQTDFAQKQTMESVKKEMKRGILILKNIKFNSLSQEDKRKNADELAKFGQLQQLLKVL